MNLSLYIARRLSLASAGKKTSPAVAVATVAVALSISVMIAAIAIVTGFKHQITDKVVGFNSHISMSVNTANSTDNNILLLSASLEKTVGQLPFVTDYGLQSSIPAILKTREDFKGIYLKNDATEATSSFLRSNLEAGVMPDFSKPEHKNDIMISRRAANDLNLNVGDDINSYFLSNDIRVRKLHVAGIFNSHFDSYDNIFAYGSLPLIQSLAGSKPNEGTSLQITTDNLSRIDEYAQTLRQTLDEATASGLLYRNYNIETAHTRGAGYFSWLALLDTNVVVIISLMLVVACITLISGMLIVIADKKNFIGIMKSLGANDATLRNIFMFLALRITVVGLLIGNVIAIGLLLIQQYTHFIPLDPDSYYINFVPVSLSWPAVGLLNSGVIAIVYLSLILPSRFVARIAPATSMRYE